MAKETDNAGEGRQNRAVIQDWVMRLPLMQQTVLLAAIRGPDGVTKEHPAKELLRWFRRCILLSAMDGKVLLDPDEPGGGSFTGPSNRPLLAIAHDFLSRCDELPHHFLMHIVHAAEIVGYKHPSQPRREWWRVFYFTCVNSLHLEPESEAAMDQRLGDSFDGWQAAEMLGASRMEREHQRKLNTVGELCYDGSCRWPRSFSTETVESFRLPKDYRNKHG